MKLFILVISLCAALCEAGAQELYVFSEPASNMPARSVALRFTGRFPVVSGFRQRYMPEIMVGFNKYWMLHISSTFSDYYSRNVKAESGKIYGKYRFYSKDELHRHFRIAAFGEVAWSNAPYQYDDAGLEGDNSGLQGGFIATQLLNKLALSAAVSYSKIFAPDKKKIFTGAPAYQLLNYTLSAGYLLLPVEYKNYSQANLNAYIEVLGSKSLDRNKYAIDLAPALQCILNSNTKINLGYRFQLGSNMNRIASYVWQAAIEHTLFNVWK